MTTRPPASLQSRLRAAHARVRRALIARHALRATAAAVVLLAFCVTAGLALPRVDVEGAGLGTPKPHEAGEPVPQEPARI